MSIATSFETAVAIASAVTTATLALVALLFAYRQNVGWKPIIVMHHPTLSGMGGSKMAMALTVEVWNRRKYPVVVQSVTAEVSGARVRDTDFRGFDHPFVKHSTFSAHPNAVVDPSDRQITQVQFDLEDQSLDALRPLILVKVRYFDPYLNRTSLRRGRYRFFYPELGWKKSAAELRDAQRAFASIRAKQGASQ